MALITIQEFKKEQAAKTVATPRGYRPEWMVDKFLSDAYSKLAPERRKVTDLLVKAQAMFKEAMSLPFSAVRSAMFSNSFGLVDEARHLESRIVLPFAYDRLTVPGNLLLNEGITVLQGLLIGTGGTVFSNANANLGVGDSSTAASASQTGLQAATNKVYKAMESGFPSVTAQTTTWRAVYGTTDANFAWNEFTVANGNSDAADNLNRKVSAEGTKSSGQIWTLSLNILWA